MNIFDMKPRSGYRREESEDKGEKTKKKPQKWRRILRAVEYSIGKDN